MGKEGKNIHKFVSFTERISKLRIDVVHKIEKRTETPEDSETFFQLCLSKWTELNCSLDFQEFYKEVSTLVKSFSLLVYHQKTVVEILQRHLKKKDTLALDALLELCVELSRDLQGDFCPYFTEFLHIIASHLDTKDAQKIEDCFKTLAYLFKFQWRYLVKDMKPLFRSYSHLLRGDQAAHIHLFAAESFAFLLRKTKDLSELVDEILINVLENPQLCPGIGRLFAETVKGVQKQFHSCTENVLTTLLSKLEPDCLFKSAVGTDADGKMVFRVFVCMFHEMAKYAVKENTQVVWDCLINSVNRIYPSDGRDEHESGHDLICDRLSLLVQLTDVWTKWKAGELILHPVQLYEMVTSLMNINSMSLCLRTSVLKLTSSLLLANCPDLKEGYEKKLLCQVFTSKRFYISDICQFARCLKQSFLFPDNVTPKLVSHVETQLSKSSLNSEEVSEILFMLAEIVVEKLSFVEGFDESTLDEVTIFSFPKLAGRKGHARMKILFNLDLALQEPLSGSAMENTWATLVCLPFVRPLDVEPITQSIIKVLTHLRAEATSSTEKIQPLFLLSCAIECLSLLCKFHKRRLEEILPFDSLLTVLRDHSYDVHVLQACHVYLSVIKQQNSSSILSSRNLLLVYPILERNLSSHAHLVRLLTLKILTVFEQLKVDTGESSSDTEVTNCSVFEDCLEAELVPLTFHDYRQKLIVLQKLLYSKIRHLPDAIKEAPLRYLIGILYVNLSTMWDPVMSIIATYAVEENKKSFWNVFYEYLSQASSDAAKAETGTGITELSSTSNSLSTFFQQRLTLSIGPREDNRVDYQNFRLLLWKAMEKFPQVVEPRSRQVVPLFLDFVRNECSLINEAGDVSYQNILKSCDRSTDSDQEEMDVDVAVENDDENGQKTIVDCRRKAKAVRPLRMKTLIACLSLFRLFKNPRRLFQEPVMKQLYLTLLTQKDGEIQKLGLACLLTYKLDYLLPYKDNLDRLLEDKTFKDELMNFSSNEELNIVSEEHRGDLVHVLIR